MRKCANAEKQILNFYLTKLRQNKTERKKFMNEMCEQTAFFCHPAPLFWLRITAKRVSLHNACMHVWRGEKRTTPKTFTVLPHYCSGFLFFFFSLFPLSLFLFQEIHWTERAPITWINYYLSINTFSHCKHDKLNACLTIYVFLILFALLSLGFA